MIKFFQGLFYRIFRRLKKGIELERDEIKLSVRLLKDELSAEDKNAYTSQIFSRVENLKQFKNADCVLFFLSKDTELATKKYIIEWSKTKTVLLPSIKNDKLNIKKFVGLKESQDESNAHSEIKTVEYDGKIDLAIVPAVAFDYGRHRMGQGRNLYKKYLKFKRTYTIGVGFDFQIVEKIPYYYQDIKLDAVITPSKTLH